MVDVTAYTIHQNFTPPLPKQHKPKLGVMVWLTQCLSLVQGFLAQGVTFKPLQPFKQWLENVNVRDGERARFLCQVIPAQCPFERDIRFFGKVWFHIPPLCKLNPFYEQLVMLRFKSLCYLADECGEDITPYC